jgi:hypothetical protein
VIDVDYPAIVEPALWQAAQDANGAGTACVQRATVDRFLLRGAMVRCTDHDHAMTGATGGNSKTQYRCIRQLPTGKRATHCVPARDLDEAVWAEIRAFLLAPGRGIAAARALTTDAERELEHVARQRAGNAARRAELDRQAAYLARCARETAIAPKVLEGQLREIDAEQERLCAADVRLAAREEVARDVLPQAAEIEAICRELAAGAAHATPTERRAILDALDVTVAMDGFDYTISGVVPSLRCQGTLWVHAERSC